MMKYEEGNVSFFFLFSAKVFFFSFVQKQTGGLLLRKDEMDTLEDITITHHFLVLYIAKKMSTMMKLKGVRSSSFLYVHNEAEGNASQKKKPYRNKRKKKSREVLHNDR